jgi:glycosyltransferase involved in cell wall biosynthesis
VLKGWRLLPAGWPEPWRLFLPHTLTLLDSEVEVGIGIPVYNGAATLSLVLEQLTSQTHHKLTIVVSDNNSTDATPAICAEWAARDPRIRYLRKSRTVSPTDNFTSVLSQCASPYFMWAAHDDFRDPDYVEKLLAALRKRPDAILAFGDIVATYTDGRVEPFHLDFATEGHSAAARLRRAALSPLHHLYGLWRTDALTRVSWRHVDWWHDMPLMMAASQLGEMIYVPGVRFYYKNNMHPFFDWFDGEADGRGVVSNLAHWGRRLGDLSLLVWRSGCTVGQVAGTGRGLQAAGWACAKIGMQVSGFLWRRRPGRVVGTVPH